jgi:hypothetical protein
MKEFELLSFGDGETMVELRCALIA